MMNPRRYEKQFLMLRKDATGFAIGTKQPWGSCILELKNNTGRLSLSVNSLRRHTDGYPVYAIAQKENTPYRFYCGRISPDLMGKANLTWDFHPDDMDGTNVSAEHLVAIAVLEDLKRPTAPLVAFVNNPCDWRSLFLQAEQRSSKTAPETAQKPTLTLITTPPAVSVQPQENVLQSVPDAYDFSEDAATASAEEIPEEKKEPPEEKPLSAAESNPFQAGGDFRALLAAFRKEMEELEAAGILQPQKTTAQTAKEPAKEEPDLLTPFMKNPCLYPFGEDTYYCISRKELALLPMFSPQMLHDPFFMVAERKYRHFLIGKQADGIYIGVPDVADAPTPKEDLGFGVFLPLTQDRTHGYWMKKIRES